MGPLEGIKVIDLSAVVSGPLAGTLMADQGAEVIKVERITGDLQRNIGSRRDGFSGMFHVLNRGKRSIAVDLQSTAGIDVIKKLVKNADVVIQNFRPGVVQRLGIDYESLSAENPGLVYLSISGFGQEGPESGKRAYDPIIQSFSGVTVVQGLQNGDGVPEQVNQLILDKLTAYNGLQAITAALLSRSRTKSGQHIELSMLDSAVAFMWPDSGADMILQGEGIDHRPAIGGAGTLIQATDGWIIMMIMSDHEFQGLCNAFELAEIAKDPRFGTLQARQENREVFGNQIKPQIQQRAKIKSIDELVENLTREQVPHAVVRSLSELPNEPQCEVNRLFRQREHPIAGPLIEVRPAAVFNGTPLTLTDSAPIIGQHTREIMVEYGMGDLISELVQGGVIGTPD